ncbi:uracil-DNA glycosylase [Alcanivorax sp. S71-1-4]|nr:uracil-DNA glycosylase [Alcanivorax sp. S71-1-4]KAF0806405.1 uracil-DNA glycosylase [Alcanivorax sp. S71-1-4]
MEPGWKAALGTEFDSEYMLALRAFLLEEKKRGKVVYPPGPQIFNAFNTTPFDKVKVVILGQDPYHGPGQAHGLSFSVPAGVPPPPSLQNIFKEIHRDLGIDMPRTGCLVPWAEQGVLLLNAVLTVEQRQAASHQGKGWERFTDAAIDHLNRERQGLVFMLWGSYAQRKGNLIDRKRHLVLTAPHPSPLSAHRGFIGCGHFSSANDWLVQQGKTPIDWRL